MNKTIGQGGILESKMVLEQNKMGKVGCGCMVRFDAKTVFSDSLKELLKNNAFTDIGVKDIVQNCNASRTAFYNHFKDKYDLVCWIYKTESEQICKNFNYGEWREYHTNILEYMQKERAFYANVSSYEGQNCILDYVTSYAIHSMGHLVKRQLGVNTLPEDVETSLYMWNLARTKMVFTWIRTNDSRSAKDMSTLICNCIPEPMSSFFH